MDPLHLLADAASDSLAAVMRHKTYLGLFAAGVLASYALTALHIRLAERLGWVDRPGGRKQHAVATPTLGGLPVFAVVFLGVLAAWAFGNRVSEMLREHRVALLAAGFCTLVMLLLGVADDLRGLRPRVKLLVEAVVAIAAYALGFQITAITVPWMGTVALGPLAPVVSLMWIIGVTNAVNLTDGLDGLAAGVGFLAAATNALLAVWLGNYYMAVMMAVLAGSLLGFLCWNFHPARVFLGDTGSLALGMFLALCSLHSAQKSHTVVMLLVPLCALGYPIFDTLLTVARRTARGQPLFASDRAHVHHRLAERAYGASGAALRIYLASLALLAVCVLLSSMNHFFVGMGLATALMLAVFSVRVLGYLEWGGWAERFRGREEIKVVYAAAALTRLKLQAATGASDVAAALGVLAAELGGRSLEIEHAGEVYRWTHGTARAGARQWLPINDLGLSGGVELSADSPLLADDQGPESGPANAGARRSFRANRAGQLWEEACGLAAQRLAAWAVPSSASGSGLPRAGVRSGTVSPPGRIFGGSDGPE